jgi:MoaA/NifB/PqqE/SkfB family radical SAM enzyme
LGNPSSISIDIEPTNRCNADCYFCPRDQTPHQGLMTPETFRAALDRSEELRAVAVQSGHPVRMSFCGLGEPLLNKHMPTFISQARARGFEVSMSSNAGLLDERRANAVLDAGLQQIDINVGERGEDYEDIYKLSWDKTRDNILRFAELAEGRCEVQIILVDHRGDRQHLADMEQYWRDLGLEKFFSFNLINRGGALFVDHMQFGQVPQRAEAQAMLDATEEPTLCVWPFSSMVVGYDGQYYLCCSDWKKEYPLGSVHDTSFVDVLGEKVALALHKATVCQTCNLNPLNALTEELQARDQGADDAVDPKWMVASLRAGSRSVVEIIDDLEPGTVAAALEAAPGRSRRKLIPLIQT